METKQNITPTFIRDLSYPDFVGFINQWNTPPGSYSTISKLAVFSDMDSSSRVLEVACTTGFSSREFAVKTGCSGTGFDRSEHSIRMANYNKENYAPDVRVSYEVADGYQFQAENKFTHIAVTGGLAFFPDPQRMLDRCIGMLEDGGHILATPYYQTGQLPDALVERMHAVLGIPMSAFADFSYKKVMQLYNKLEIVFEERNALTQETDEELAYYCESVIKRACRIHSIRDDGVYQAMHDRLLSIRKLINEGRPYQEYCVLVLRYRSSVYPDRFTALF